MHKQAATCNSCIHNWLNFASCSADSNNHVSDFLSQPYHNLLFTCTSQCFSLCIALHQAALYVKVASGNGAEEAVGQHPLDAATSSRLVIVDGVASPELSSLSSMPDGVYVGGIENAPSQAVSQQLVSCY